MSKRRLTRARTHSFRWLLIPVALLTMVASIPLASGCGGDDDSDTSEATENPQSVSGEINVAASVGINEPIVQALADTFEEAFPKITVNVTGINYLNLYERQLVGLRAESSEFDIVTHTPSFFSVYAANGFLEPLDPYVESGLADPQELALEGYAQSLLDANRAEDELVGLPFIVFPPILFYREDLYKQAGLEVPQTMDEMMETSVELDDPPGVYGNTVQGVVGGAGANTYNWYPFLFSFGGDILDDEGQPVINSPEAVEALQYYVDLFECCSPEESVNWEIADTADPMINGNLAQQVIDADSGIFARDRTKFPLGAATLPEGPAGSISMAGMWSNSISAFSDNKDAAFLFLQYLGSPSAQDTYIEEGGVPPRPSALEDAKDPVLRVVAEQLDSGVKGLPVNPKYLQMEDAIGRAISEALQGNMSPQEALDDAQGELEELAG